MPTLNCNARYLYHLIGKTFSDLEFESLCFKFGLEVESNEIVGTEKYFKIDCPANRHDLLSSEGLAMALRSYIGLSSFPGITLQHTQSPTKVKVLPAVKTIRPFVSCAILRNVTFTAESLESFIEYQEKLHQSLCRKRSLASVGTHDLDKLSLPIRYDAWSKAEIKFTPLKQATPLCCAGNGLADFYRNDKHIFPYVGLLSGYEKYPVIVDSQSKILSLPPIINSAQTEVTVSTKNIFVEVTGVDQNKVNTLLNLMVASFSSLCEKKFTVEAVDIGTDEGKHSTPILNDTLITCSRQSFAKRIGIPVEALENSENLRELLQKMQLKPFESKTDAGYFTVSVPPNRPDILHECDIMEDIAIAYGYDKLVKERQEVKTVSEGRQTKFGKLSKAIKAELAHAGYCESLSFSLCSHDEAFHDCLKSDDGKTAVRILNPQTKEFQICRPALLPGILKTVASNLKEALPIRLFEVSDVVLKSEQCEVGARNEHRLGCFHAHGESSSFENIRGTLDYLFQKLDIKNWHLKPNSSLLSSYMNGRCAEIFMDTDSGAFSVGHMGVLHPKILNNFGIPFPCSYLEISMGFLLED